MDDQLTPSETLIDDRKSFTTVDKIRLSPNGGHVEGPGVIETVLVRADNNGFRVTVETDHDVIVNDDFETMKTLSDDLTHVDAYVDNNHYVFVVQEYPYAEWSRVTINPIGEVTFDRLRGEWITGVPVSY